MKLRLYFLGIRESIFHLVNLPLNLVITALLSAYILFFPRDLYLDKCSSVVLVFIFGEKFSETHIFIAYLKERNYYGFYQKLTKKFCIHRIFSLN